MISLRIVRHCLPLAVVALLLFSWSVSIAPGFAQVPRPDHPPTGSDPRTPPSGLPAMPPGMTTEAPAPVVPDTSRVELVWPVGSAQPSSLFMVPDTLLFGEVAAIVIEYPTGSAMPDESDLENTPDWLPGYGEVSQEHLDLLNRLASSDSEQGNYDPAESSRLVIPVRVYRTDPFILTSGQIESPVFLVQGRTTDLSSTAPIRAPRVRGWNLWLVAAIALVATLILVFILNRWHKRVAGPTLVDWELSNPAWILASDRLLELLDSRILDRGQSREFLNELASITRGFAADRFNIPAREMTGDEIISACRERGFSTIPISRLSRLIDESDFRRYDPDPVDGNWCRNQVTLLVSQISKIRVIPRQTPVPAQARIESEKTWSNLTSFVGEAGTQSEENPDDVFSEESV